MKFLYNEILTIRSINLFGVLYFITNSGNNIVNQLFLLLNLLNLKKSFKFGIS